MDNIDFYCDFEFCEENTEEGLVSFYVVHFKIKINNELLVISDVGCFDFYSIFCNGTLKSTITPYNCECGVPDCIGISEEVELIPTNKTITWIFPKTFYEKNLNKKIIKENLSYTFDRAEYINKIDNFVEEIESQIQMLDTKIALTPGYDYVSHLISNNEFKNNIKKSKKYLQEYKKKLIVSDYIFKNFKTKEIIIKLKTNDELSLSFSAFLEVVLDIDYQNNPKESKKTKKILESCISDKLLFESKIKNALPENLISCVSVNKEKIILNNEGLEKLTIEEFEKYLKESEIYISEIY